VPAFNSLEKVTAAARAALEKKANDLIVLDVSGLSGYTDYFLICDGRSSTQRKAITEHVQRRMRSLRVRPHHVEGDAASSPWVLMDYDDFIVHVFHPETRAHYGLESLWLDAPRISLTDP